GRPKLLLPWGNTSILGHLLTQWSKVGASQIAVVVAPDHSALESELAAHPQIAPARIVNPAPDQGMFSSILSAARWPHWNCDVTHWIVALGDQPHLQLTTLERLLEAALASPDAICQPARSNRPRHPVALLRSAFERLRQTNAANLREFLEASPERRLKIEMDDPGLDLDIDTPQDYEAAQKAGLRR
ncbi:MAG: nucleotidyltransferase family protein, partial [Verrucomicrobia subdivision 3 bacterium]|nr:nucleotidyltransferase family protein [Limisphaerales bacterium]